MTWRGLVALAAFVATASASGCSGPDEVPDVSSPAELVDTTALVADPAPIGTAVLDTSRDAAEQGEIVPTGSATLSVGERTWSFPSVVCLFDGRAAQQEASFAMSSSSADGYLLYAAITPAGDIITVQAVAGVAPDDVSFTTAEATSGSFIRVAGSAISARARFVPVDDTTAPGVPGTLSADCAVP